MIWIVFSVMAAAAFLTLAFSGTSRKTSVLSRHESASAIFADQITEVERDQERGIISAGECKAAKAEIERRLRAIDRQADGEPTARPSGRALVLAAALAVPALGAALYWQVGSPGIPSQPFAERAGEQAQAREIADLAAKLKARLELDETGGPTDGWAMLGQTYMRMGRYEDAAGAFARVQDRPEVTSALASQYGEALVYAEDGIVTPKASRVFDRALELDPANPAASFYQALALEQAGAPDAAYDLLQARIESEDGYRPWMDSFAAQMNRIAALVGLPGVDLADLAPAMPGPTAEQAATAEQMSDEDRQAFIRSMVERLAARMQENPGDLDGWMRLGKAYAVLGESNSARDAYSRAKVLADDLPQDDPRRAGIDRALLEL